MGSGPAGYTAAIYTGRANLSPVLYEGMLSGGQLTTTTEIENFPGYPEGVMGTQLMEDLRKQAERFGVQIINEGVSSLDLALPVKQLRTPYGSYGARSVIVATGARPRKLGVPGEARVHGLVIGQPERRYT